MNVLLDINDRTPYQVSCLLFAFAGDPHPKHEVYKIYAHSAVEASDRGQVLFQQDHVELDKSNIKGWSSMTRDWGNTDGMSAS